MAFVSYIAGSASMAVFLILGVKFNVPSWVIACLWWILGVLCMYISENIFWKKINELKEITDLEKYVKRINQKVINWRRNAKESEGVGI